MFMEAVVEFLNSGCQCVQARQIAGDIFLLLPLCLELIFKFNQALVDGFQHIQIPAPLLIEPAYFLFESFSFHLNSNLYAISIAGDKNFNSSSFVSPPRLVKSREIAAVETLPA